MFVSVYNEVCVDGVWDLRKEPARWRAVMSTRPRTSALRMPSTHPAIRNANHRL